MPETQQKIIRTNLDISDLLSDFDQSHSISADEQSTIISNVLRKRYRGKASHFNTDFHKNLASIEWGIDISSDKAPALHQKAIAAVNQKDLSKAITLWKEAVQEEPYHPDFYFNLGLVYIELKDYKPALNYLQQTIEICPIYKKALFLLGSLYSKMRQFDEAEKYLIKALEFDKQNATLYVNLGAIYSVTKQYDKAIIAFERAIAISAKEVKAYFGLGKVYLAKGDHENANRCFKVVIKLDPEGKLGQLAKRSIKTVEPADKNSKPVDKNDNQAAIDDYYHQGYQAYIKGQYDQAVKHYQNFLHANPHDADVWVSLASCQLHLGKLDDSIKAIHKALGLRPSKAAFYKQAAIIYDAADNREKTIEMAQKAYELGKEDSITLTLLGKNNYELGKLTEAMGFLKEAINANPNNLNARFHYAMLLKSQGQIDSARQHLEEVIWNKSNSPLKERARKEIEDM